MFITVYKDGCYSKKRVTFKPLSQAKVNAITSEEDTYKYGTCDTCGAGLKKIDSKCEMESIKSSIDIEVGICPECTEYVMVVDAEIGGQIFEFMEREIIG